MGRPSQRVASARSKVHAFVSYARADEVIATVLADELGRLGRSNVECFLDTRSIPAGVKWQPVIIGALKRSDWLIAVFTGEQSEYCGYEIAMFSHFNGLVGDGPNKDGRLVCLHDVEEKAVPTVLAEYQGVAVPSPEDVRKLEGLSKAEVDEHWYNSPLGRFLRRFCGHRQLYPSNDDSYRHDIALAAERIAGAFLRAKSTDVIEDTPCQLRLELSVLGSEEGFEQVPDSAPLTGSTQTFAMFGLNLPQGTGTQPRQITWGELKARLLRPPRPDVPWMDKISDDIVATAAKRRLDGNDATLVGDDRRIYRPILGRHQLLLNGTRKFYVMFVETLKREFPGRQETSLLLGSLVVASRFRFRYFEQWDEDHAYRFGQDAPFEDFLDACTQLRYDLERLDHETVELGLGDEEAVLGAFGPNNRARVERFFVDWFASRRALLAALPAARDKVGQDHRARMHAAVREFFAATRRQNSDFLELAARTYSDRMLGDLKRDRELERLAEPPSRKPSGADDAGTTRKSSRRT